MLQVIKHYSGMEYIKGKTYYVAGARSVWDQVLIGLFDTRSEGEGNFHQCPQCIREATQKEINDFFNIN